MTIPRIELQDSPESFDLTYEDVSFPSRSDGILLRGWLMPSEKEQVILVVNGGYQNRIDDNGATLSMTAALVDNGYNVLLFDLRGRGISDGTGHSLANAEEDIGGAVDYLNSRGFETGDIVVMGFCSGAALSTYYVINNEVGALVLDGCFIKVSTMVIREAKDVGVHPVFTTFFLPGLHMMSSIIYGFREVNPVDIVDDIKCPIFFIHEEFDDFVTMEETRRLYDASGNPRDEIWHIIGAGHSEGFLLNPEEYTEKVTGFLRRTFQDN